MIIFSVHNLKHAQIISCVALAIFVTVAVSPMVVVSAFSTPVPKSRYPAFEVKILTKQDVLAVGEKAKYSLSMFGGPAASNTTGRNYSYRAYLTGENLTGGAPTLESPATETSITGNFTINVTAPSTPQTVTLVVNATSKNDNDTEYKELRFVITVVQPVIIDVEVWNTGTIIVENVRVWFYVDELKIGERVIEKIEPSKSVNISCNWTVAYYPPGWHRAKIELMPGNYMVQFKNGARVIYKEFYIMEKKEGTILWNLGIFITALLIPLLVLAIWSARKKLPRR